MGAKHAGKTQGRGELGEGVDHLDLQGLPLTPSFATSFSDEAFTSLPVKGMFQPKRSFQRFPLALGKHYLGQCST